MRTPTLLTAALTLPALALGAALPDTTPDSTAAAAARAFTGTGQLRTRWNDGAHDDLGCLTDGGLWTADDAQCGTFTATALHDSSLKTFSLASKAGPCQIRGARFTCEEGNQLFSFGIWPWPNSIPGVPCLRYGQYGLMASWGSNPPAADEAPEEIHLVTDSEVGKYVWVTWAPVNAWK